MRRALPAAGLAIALALGAPSAFCERTVTLRYAHPNAPDSVAGRQAALFARKVGEYTGGAVTVEVHPASRLGTLKEQAEQAKAGVVAFHHQTAAGLGNLYEDFSVLDMPYLMRDLSHLLRVADPASPVMAKLGEGLRKKIGLRVLYTFYFGTRELTCDRPVLKPEDLAGLLVRAIPSPLYEAVVEGLGARAVPIDWSQTPVALASGSVNGQENPVETVLASRLYESQSCLMLTGHIMGAEIVVVNDAVWQKLSPKAREGIERAAREASAYATLESVESERRDLAALAAKGMRIIGPAEGLDAAAFAARCSAYARSRFGARWKEYIDMIEALK